MRGNGVKLSSSSFPGSLVTVVERKIEKENSGDGLFGDICCMDVLVSVSKRRASDGAFDNGFSRRTVFSLLFTNALGVVRITNFPGDRLSLSCCTEIVYF